MDFDVLHFHWPEWMVRRKPRWFGAVQGFPGSWRTRRTLSKAVPWARILEYQAFLGAARACGKRIVWTCHNLEPHEGLNWPVRAAFRSLAGHADLVICHDEAAKLACESLYSPRAGVVVMPIGNYDGVYPPGRSKTELLKEIGLPVDVPLLLCVGQIRPYKGTDIACEAAAELGTTASLLVAGYAPILSYYHRVKAMMEELPNAVLLNKELTEEEFGGFVRASELVLFPYRSVTGSSAVLAALTLRRGVIASDLPFFRSLLQGHESAGRLFASGDARSLALAIKDFLKVPTAEREEAAQRLSSTFDWARVILPVARALRDLVSATRHDDRTPEPTRSAGPVH